jgi:hypothetical protein
VLTFISPRVTQAFQQTSARVAAELCSQAYASADGFRPPPATQNLLCTVMAGGAGSALAVAQLTRILTSGGNTSPEAVASAEALSESLHDILARGILVNSAFFNILAATQLATASATYNALIASSGESFLSSPPAEVTALRAILRQFSTR